MIKFSEWKLMSCSSISRCAININQVIKTTQRQKFTLLSTTQKCHQEDCLKFESNKTVLSFCVWLIWRDATGTTVPWWPEEGTGPNNMCHPVLVCMRNMFININTDWIVTYDNRWQVRDWKRSKNLWIQSTNAVNIHWWRTKKWYDINEGHARCPSRRQVI